MPSVRVDPHARNDADYYLKPLQGETAFQFAAFCLYRDLPKEARTVTNAYNQHARKWNRLNPHRKQKRIIPIDDQRGQRNWQNYCYNNFWDARVRVADAHLDQRARELRKEEWDKEAKQYRDLLRSSSMLAITSGINAVKKAKDRLDKATALDKDGKPLEEIPIKSIPALMRAGAFLIQAGQDGVAMSLGLDELIELLDVSQDANPTSLQE